MYEKELYMYCYILLYAHGINELPLAACGMTIINYVFCFNTESQSGPLMAGGANHTGVGVSHGC